MPKPCCGRVKSRSGDLGRHRCLWPPLDAHLIAIDAKNGHPAGMSKWRMPPRAMPMNAGPLVIKDKKRCWWGSARRRIRAYRGSLAAYEVRKKQRARKAWEKILIYDSGARRAGTRDLERRFLAQWRRIRWVTGSYDPNSTSPTGAREFPRTRLQQRAA